MARILEKEELNNYLQSDGIATADKSVLKSVISTLESIGNNKSFNILFSLYINPEFESVQNELETTLIKLAPNYIDEILYIINEKDIAKNKLLFEKIVKTTNCAFFMRDFCVFRSIFTNFYGVEWGSGGKPPHACKILLRWGRMFAIMLCEIRNTQPDIVGCSAFRRFIKEDFDDDFWQ